MFVREGQAANWPVWACIIDRETGGTWDPEAVGSELERGLLQIHPVHIAWLGWARWERLFDPEQNILAGVELYHRAGDSFSPWRSTVGGC